MKAVWLTGILLLTQAFAEAGDTAYQALRIIGKINQDFLNHVIEARGTDGQPQPVTWTVLIDDQSARGGVREMEVSKGRVISEHTPVRAYAGAGANAVMDFKRLNLDSQGAFTIANQEAAKHNVAFDSVGYLLRSDQQSGAPVWILRLIDVNHALVGTITIAADNGAVLSTTGFGSQQPGTAAPPPPVAATTPPPVPVNGDEQPGGPPNGVGHEINKGLHRIGGALQQFFTGERTVDKRFENEP